MERNMRYLLILIFLLCSAANADDTVYIIGGGTLSCGKWVVALNERHESQQQVFLQWVVGFTGSYNWYRNKLNQPGINQPDLETTSLWLTTYCNKNPTHSTLQASAALIQHLGGEATKFKWEK